MRKCNSNSYFKAFDRLSYPEQLLYQPQAVYRFFFSSLVSEPLIFSADFSLISILDISVIWILFISGFIFPSSFNVTLCLNHHCTECIVYIDGIFLPILPALYYYPFPKELNTVWDSSACLTER